LQSRHKTWTNQLPACSDSRAFSEITEGALFLPGAKDDRNPLQPGGFSCFCDTPYREGIEVGTGDGGGVLAESVGKS